MVLTVDLPFMDAVMSDTGDYNWETAIKSSLIRKPILKFSELSAVAQVKYQQFKWHVLT